MEEKSLNNEKGSSEKILIDGLRFVISFLGASAMSYWVYDYSVDYGKLNANSRLGVVLAISSFMLVPVLATLLSRFFNKIIDNNNEDNKPILNIIILIVFMAIICFTLGRLIRGKIQGNEVII